jgi:WD40 repeat protein
MDLADAAPRLARTETRRKLENELVKSGLSCSLSCARPQERVVVVSPDSQWLVTAGEHVRLWRLADRRLVRTIGDHARTAISAAFSPDSKQLVTSTYHDSVRIWSVPSGKLVTTIPTGDSNNVVAFSKTGSEVIAGGINGPMRVWSATDGKLVRAALDRFALQSIAVSRADGTIFAASRLWDPGTGSVVRTLDNGQGGYLAAEFSRDGVHLATGGGSAIAGQDFALRIFEVATGKLLHRITSHPIGITAIAFSPDGKLVASGDYQGTLRLTRVDDGSAVATGAVGRAIADVAFSPKGDVVFVALHDGGIHQWRPGAKPAK